MAIARLDVLPPDRPLAGVRASRRACLLVPVLWEPVLRLCREHQLTSLADLFAFRFHSQQAGFPRDLHRENLGCSSLDQHQAYFGEEAVRGPGGTADRRVSIWSWW